MVDAQTVSIVFAGLGITASIVYYASVIRNTNRARQREMMFQRLQGYSLEYTKAFAEVWRYTDFETVEEFTDKYGWRSDPETFSKYLFVTRIYNLAGILLQENMADSDLIFKLYPPASVIGIWERFEPLIFDRRRRINHPGFYEPFEFLVNEMRKRFPELHPVS